MTKKFIIIDCRYSGISGDMLLAALIDLFGDYDLLKKLGDLVDYLPGCEEITIDISDVKVNGLRAKQFRIKCLDRRKSRTPEELEKAARNLAKRLNLSLTAIKIIENTLKTIFEAEAKVHKEEVKRLHLHETGSPDTVVDVVGTAYIIEKSGISWENIYGTPLAIGRGPIKFSHGVVQAPVPAVVEILKEKRYPVIGRPIETEIATPTGVALLVNIVSRVIHDYPLMYIRGIGYGIGTRRRRGHPQALRVILGEEVIKHDTDTIVVLETTVDDVSGEFLGRTIKELMREGALDVSIIPAMGKKNRPSHIIKVLCREEQVLDLAKVLMLETGTLGVRTYTVNRLKLFREIIPVQIQLKGKKYRVRIKVSRDSEGRLVNLKPEYDDIDQIAREIKMPARMLWLKILTHAFKEIKE